MLSKLWLNLFISSLLMPLFDGVKATPDLDCTLERFTNATCDYLDQHHLICHGDIVNDLSSSLRLEEVYTLTLCEWSREILDPQFDLRGYLSLRKFILVNGNLTKLSSPFPPEARFLEEIQITGTSLREVPPGCFDGLQHLRILDLRNNALEAIDPDLSKSGSLRYLYLSGNRLRCTMGMTWLLDMENLADKDELRCSAPYEGRPLVHVLEIIRALHQECKRTVCDCELVYVVGRAGKHLQKQLMAFVEVNCSRRGLTEMPDFLPSNTTTLRLAGNKIRDLSPLTTNPVYKGVMDLYLEDNMVESIVELEGSRWLENFRLLDLRKNGLTDLPTYALENVLLQSGNAASLYLGGNPWRCDCLFTPGFQDLLIRYTNLMKDISNVRCASVKGDENSNKQIRDLTRTEICVSWDEDPLLHPLDILSIVLALLILLILGKLLYDYWSFKKTGKLPWIVTKIP